MPGMLTTRGNIGGALSGANLPGALSGGNPMGGALAQMLLSGMSQGSGLIPQRMGGGTIPTMAAGDWSTPQGGAGGMPGMGMGPQSPEDMSAFLAWLKANGLDAATGAPMPSGPMMGG